MLPRGHLHQGPAWTCTSASLPRPLGFLPSCTSMPTPFKGLAGSIQTLPQDPIHPHELHQGTCLSPDLLKGLGPFGGTRYHDWALGIQSWAWDQQPLGFEPQLHWWRTPHGLGLSSSFIVHQSPEEVIQLVCAWVGILATCWGSGGETFIS